jgi:hypothetical protein
LFQPFENQSGYQMASENQSGYQMASENRPGFQMDGPFENQTKKKFSFQTVGT